MTPGAIELAVRGDTGTGSYRFICPACLTLVQKRADRKIVELLSSVGVSVSAPVASLSDPSESADGPEGTSTTMFEMPWEPRRPTEAGRSPLTYDDLISFHFLLQDDAWIAEVMGEATPEQGRGRRPQRT